MQSYFCKWLWHSATMLCDGTITCGLDDPFRLRNYGNIKNQSLAQILAGPLIDQRRTNLLGGTDCGNCHLHNVVDGSNIHQLAPSRPYPKTLIVEASIRCNIRCNNTICNIANDSTMHVRDEDFLKFPVFKKAFDEIGPHLEELYFWNYGEPFINPLALEMLAYAKSVNPAVRVASSTNGLLLTRGDLAERVVLQQSIDWLCFTIGGMDEESYAKYHKSSSFAKAIEGMSKVVEAKRRHGIAKPIVHWRYLLFNWNDRDEQIEEAQRLAREIGVDEFQIFLTSVPLEGRSLRRAPGTQGFEDIRPLLEFDAHYRADPYAEAGLHHREHHPELGPVCWTGRTARVTVLPQNGSVSLKLCVVGGIPLSDQPVRVRLPWGTFTAEVGEDTWIETTIAMPENFASDFPVAVEITVPAPASPLRLRLSEDIRELGVLLSMSGVTPMQNPHRQDGISTVGARLGAYA